MKVLLLNGAKEQDRTAKLVNTVLQDVLGKNSHNIRAINLRDIEIASCLGCFGCWVKTPGKCVIDDEGRKVAEAVVQSDLVITVTPITFGGYSYELKKAIDRLIPIISPFFKKIKGEVHHKRRYERYPNYINFGILSEMDDEMANTFRDLVTRNAINMHNPISLSSILLRDQSDREIKLEIRKILQKVGV